MRKLLWLLGFVSCFSLATVMDSTFYELRSRSNGVTSVAAAMLGDSRAVFAGLLFRQADVTFHSGFYPTVFDKQETDIDVKGEGEGATTETNAKPEIEETFLGSAAGLDGTVWAEFLPHQPYAFGRRARAGGAALAEVVSRFGPA